MVSINLPVFMNNHFTDASICDVFKLQKETKKNLI